MSSESNTWVCQKCGAVVGIGQYPYCRGLQSDHGKWAGAEEPMEEVYCEHFSTDGETFTSRRAMVRYMDKHALEPAKLREGQSKIARGATGKALFFDLNMKR